MSYYFAFKMAIRSWAVEWTDRLGSVIFTRTRRYTSVHRMTHATAQTRTHTNTHIQSSI